jgi:nitroreductase
MTEKFKIAAEVIKNRRTIKPAKMNGKMIPDEHVMELLRLADWAPTHKHTEPWRFFVYAGKKAKEFALAHAELYKSTSGREFQQEKYNKILGNGNNVSHIIVSAMKRDAEKRIPETEEICSTAAAIENILIGAAAMGIAGYWSTGGMAHKDEFKKFLGLSDDDLVIGIIYLGYSDHIHQGKRIIPLEEKIKWNK